MFANPPVKPFSDYKWRFASFTPAEGLLRSDVFLGVLRAARDNEGKKKSSPDFAASLRVVQSETHSSITLDRPKAGRGLFRNAGQYWTFCNLLAPTKGQLQLTEFGHQVASGQITETEFALCVVKTLTLPNPLIDSSATINQWQAAGLEIKPLELMLSIFARLGEVAGAEQAFLTPQELLKVTIPLAGVKTGVDDHCEALLMFRQGKLDVSGWPDCAPDSNDPRMVREFLLFLWHHGLCRLDGAEDARNAAQKFTLSSLEAADVQELLQSVAPGAQNLDVLQDVRSSQLPAIVEEGRRVMVSVLSRPAQSRFRREVLTAYDSTCFLSGERIPTVLDAAHIVPKANGGADGANNGLCLRADIHKLFDAGHIRIEPGGKLHFSAAMTESLNYSQLPQIVTLPPFLSQEAIQWRWRYK